jgi:hypothetical protein
MGKHRLNRSSGDFLDSGAILVGAANATLPHDRAGFSSFGSRIDCYAWADSIVSAGHGDLAGTGNTSYTSTLGGTSGASPIITGAALLLQGVYAASGAVCGWARLHVIAVACWCTVTRDSPVAGTAWPSTSDSPATRSVAPPGHCGRSSARSDKLVIDGARRILRDLEIDGAQGAQSECHAGPPTSGGFACSRDSIFGRSRSPAQLTRASNPRRPR